MEVQVSSNMPQLGTFGQLHTKLGAMETQHWGFNIIDSKIIENISENGRLRISDWAGYAPHFEAYLNLGRSCSQMGPQSCSRWAEVAKWSKWAISKLGPCWPKLAPSRANVAAMWG
jgi:hypothetical protein